MSLMQSLLLVVVLSTGWLLGCTEANLRAPLRSPSLDYGAPPPQTSDGQIVGVDQKPPGDTLRGGIGSQGFAPGWQVQEKRLGYNSTLQIGGSTSQDTPQEQHEKKSLKKHENIH